MKGSCEGVAMPVRLINIILTVFTAGLIAAFSILWNTSMPPGVKIFGIAMVIVLLMHDAMIWILLFRGFRLNRKVLENQVQDPVTGLPNRRETVKKITTGLKSAKRHEYPFGVVLIAMDNFTEMNQRYGQTGGDILLKQIGEFTVKMCRAEDFVGRYDGDKFLIGLPHTDLEGTISFARRLHKQLTTNEFTSKGGRTTVKASMSLASSPPLDYLFEEVMESCNEALLKAKAHGKNKIFTEIDYVR